jgi:hypothetical protein
MLMIRNIMILCDMLLVRNMYTIPTPRVLVAELYSVVTRFMSLTGRL